MKEILLILPHQLFGSHPAFEHRRKMVLIEESLFFTQFRFHKKKLVLHRASMKTWQAHMENEGHEVQYIEANGTDGHDIRNCISDLAQQGIKKIVAVDPVDDWLYRRISKACLKNDVVLQWFPNPNFMNSPEQLDQYFKDKKHYHQTDFYIAQRKALGLLLGPDSKPVGGKWTFDSQNRERYPAGASIPKLPATLRSDALAEAMLYVDRYFPEGYGDTFG
ncbi:MAG TPA: cryptochrome/photolyase family protein, partial [Phnomibacter sp.]|nr:cryptochrome/photolyase family protein [Phnomibacter sp.]